MIIPALKNVIGEKCREEWQLFSQFTRGIENKPFHISCPKLSRKSIAALVRYLCFHESWASQNHQLCMLIGLMAFLDQNELEMCKPADT